MALTPDTALISSGVLFMLGPAELRESNWRGVLADPIMNKCCSGMILSGGLYTRGCGLVRTLLDRSEPSIDIVISETSAGLVPLFAIYNKRHPAVVDHLPGRQSYNILSLLRSSRMINVEENPRRLADPDLISFFDFDPSQDLARTETWPESDRKPTIRTKGVSDV